MGVKCINIRFNLDNEADRRLYQYISDNAGGKNTMASYSKQVLSRGMIVEETGKAREMMQELIVKKVSEEMQYQTTRIIGALFSGMSYAGKLEVSPTVEDQAKSDSKLPDACEEFPDGLDYVLDEFDCD